MNRHDETTDRRLPVARGTNRLRSCFALSVCASLGATGALTAMGMQGRPAKLSVADELPSFERIEQLRPKVPDEQNSALLFLDLVGALEEVKEQAEGKALFGFRYMKFSDGVERSCVEPSRAFRKAHAALLKRLEAVRDKPRGRFEYQWGVPPFDIDLASSDAFRTGIRLLEMDAVLEIIDGHLESAVDRAYLLWRWGAMFDGDPFYLNGLRRMSADSVGLRVVLNTLTVGELKDTTLAKIMKQLDDLARANRMKPGLRSECANLLYVIDKVGSGEMSLFDVVWGDFEKKGTPMPPAFRVGNRRAVWSLFKPMIDAADDPFELINATQRAEQAREKLSKWLYMVPKVLMPSFARGAVIHARLIAVIHATRIAVAAERYRLANGAWPKSLQVLVPKYLDKVPVDPFDRKPMRYKITERGLLIYSVYENKKDDGGVFWDKDRKPRKPDVGIEVPQPRQRGLKWVDENAKGQ